MNENCYKNYFHKNTHEILFSFIKKKLKVRERELRIQRGWVGVGRQTRNKDINYTLKYCIVYTC